MPCSVSALFIYPLKSARGVEVTTLRLDDRGAVGDRRWMLVDDRNVFLSLRDEPRLALLVPTLTGTGLHLEAPGMPPLDVDRPDEALGARAVMGQVWDGSSRVLEAEQGASAWCARFLGRSCRLVFQPDDAELPMAAKYAGALSGSRRIALTDGSPLLLIGQSSLDDLNARLAVPLPMNRFRPNIVVSGAAPFGEDGWRTIAIGAVRLEIATSCPRCVATTVDQDTGQKGQEPLRTLATYRRVGSNVMFGRNATHHAPGTIHVGDTVAVIC